jgi:hypothetical protein
MAFDMPADSPISTTNVRIERVAPSGKIARKMSVDLRDSEEDIAALREMSLRQFILLDNAIKELEV